MLNVIETSGIEAFQLLAIIRLNDFRPPFSIKQKPEYTRK